MIQSWLLSTIKGEMERELLQKPTFFTFHNNKFECLVIAEKQRALNIMNVEDPQGE